VRKNPGFCSPKCSENFYHGKERKGLDRCANCLGNHETGACRVDLVASLEGWELKQRPKKQQDSRMDFCRVCRRDIDPDPGNPFFAHHLCSKECATKRGLYD
jgi:hypothetical protein